MSQTESIYTVSEFTFTLNESILYVSKVKAGVNGLSLYVKGLTLMINVFIEGQNEFHYNLKWYHILKMWVLLLIKTSSYFEDAKFTHYKYGVVIIQYLSFIKLYINTSSQQRLLTNGLRTSVK